MRTPGELLLFKDQEEAVANRTHTAHHQRQVLAGNADADEDDEGKGGEDGGSGGGGGVGKKIGKAFGAFAKGLGIKKDKEPKKAKKGGGGGGSGGVGADGGAHAPLLSLKLNLVVNTSIHAGKKAKDGALLHVEVTEDTLVFKFALREVRGCLCLPLAAPSLLSSLSLPRLQVRTPRGAWVRALATAAALRPLCATALCDRCV